MIKDLDGYANTRQLPRSYAAQELLEQVLKRVLADNKAAENAMERGATEAARAHLAAHRRLTGLPEETK